MKRFRICATIVVAVFALWLSQPTLAETIGETEAAEAGADAAEAQVDEEEHYEPAEQKCFPGKIKLKDGYTLGVPGVDPLETYNGFPTSWIESYSAPVDRYGDRVYQLTDGESPFEVYTEDAFSKGASKRGIQGALDGGQTLVNINIDDMFEDVSKGVRFDYKGHTYFFERDTYTRYLCRANRRGIVTNVVLLLKDSHPILIEEAAREGNRHSLYYTPAMTGVGARYIEAWMAFMAMRYTAVDCHIDNFILGNEVNTPNYWHYSGNLDFTYNTNLYTEMYLQLYEQIRRYSDTARVSISVDHCWQDSDEGRAFRAKTYLDTFHENLKGTVAEEDWCISYHASPAILFEPDIWSVYGHVYQRDLNPKREDARYVDGYNLEILTDYVKEHYGETHRIMLTENVFSDHMGEEIQAASLALTYYAAKYNPMVDNMLVLTADLGGKMNFSIDEKKAREIYDALDEDPAWVESEICPVIGVQSLAEIIPDYPGKEE